MRSWFAIAAGVLVSSLALTTVTHAADTEYDEGIEYRVIKPALRATPDTGRVEVAELFWYGCPHCYHLEPDVKAWRANLPDNVDFVRVPAPLNPSWAVHSRAYYAADALGVLDATHEALFAAIHKDKRPLNTDEQLADFFAGFGVDEATYLATARSFGVAKEVRRARNLARAWGASGVPAFVVNGKYYANVSSAGGPAKLFELIDHLIARESRVEASAD